MNTTSTLLATSTFLLAFAAGTQANANPDEGILAVEREAGFEDILEIEQVLRERDLQDFALEPGLAPVFEPAPQLITNNNCDNLPTTLPKKPSLETLQCFAKRNKENNRCAVAISATACDEMNQLSLKAGLIDKAIADVAASKGVCIISGEIMGEGHILAVCPPGCFEANTQILTSNSQGDFSSIAAKDVAESDRLAVLDPSSDLDTPKLGTGTIKRLSAGPEKEALYQFELSNGKSLAVTQYHGMVLHDGRFLPAHDVTTNDAFVDVNGGIVQIESITRRETDDNVYNFELDVSSAEEHVIVAEGIFVGDLFWQSPASVDHRSISLR